MRIAVANWTARRVGGVERYLGTILPALAATDHEVAFWHERDSPVDRDPIHLPEGVPAWCAERMGMEASLHALRAWKPDLVFSHVVSTPAEERGLLDVAPAILFAHAYYGTCISGRKTWTNPTPVPCARPFGLGCLLHYYPHRCGGLSPVTMLRDYRIQSERQRLFPRYRAVVTNSAHMAAEYAANGCDPTRVHVVPLPVSLTADAAEAGRRPRSLRAERTLLFVGRMDRLKGGLVLLDAVGLVRSALGAPVRTIFVGDGPDRSAWEARAAEVAVESGVSIEFRGWAAGAALEEAWREADLLVVPSVWPEPFGMVGVEAGLRGIPAAAFAVGGIPDWLEDGVNGALAPGRRPSPAGLADAILRCLRDAAHLERLGERALQRASSFGVEAHVRGLLDLFSRVA